MLLVFHQLSFSLRRYCVQFLLQFGLSVKGVLLEIFRPFFLRSSFLLLVGELRPNLFFFFVQISIFLLRLCLERLECLFLLLDLLAMLFNFFLQLSLQLGQQFVSLFYLRFVYGSNFTRVVACKSAADV